MMNKYGTFRLFENRATKEIKKVLIGDDEELEKTASSNEWEEITNETEQHNEKED